MYENFDVAVPDGRLLIPCEPMPGAWSRESHQVWHAARFILGFNHNHARLDRPIHEQGLSSKGIRIGDDVWIGSGALLLDGVSVGSHCIVAAGAVVTRDVPDWAVVAGNPARVIRVEGKRVNPDDYKGYKYDPADFHGPPPEHDLEREAARSESSRRFSRRNVSQASSRYLPYPSTSPSTPNCGHAKSA